MSGKDNGAYRRKKDEYLTSDCCLTVWVYYVFDLYGWEILYEDHQVAGCLKPFKASRKYPIKAYFSQTVMPPFDLFHKAIDRPENH